MKEDLALFMVLFTIIMVIIKQYNVSKRIKAKKVLDGYIPKVGDHIRFDFMSLGTVYEGIIESINGNGTVQVNRIIPNRKKLIIGRQFTIEKDEIIEVMSRFGL